MKRELKNKAAIIFSSVLGVLFVAIVLNICIHIISINNFNKVEHTVLSNETSDEVSITAVKPEAWNKEDAPVSGVTNGATYSFNVENKTDYSIRDWSIRFNIEKECYLNQAWNGTVEIHQNVNSETPHVQTLDLHNFSFEYSDVVLEYAGSGTGSLMIHLYEGDFIIYHASELEAAHEIPLQGDNSSVTIGLIFYYNTSLDMASYQMSYYFGKNITQGVEWVIFCVLSTLWVILLAVAIAWVIVRHNDQKEIDIRDAMLKETIGLITSFVDAKDSYTNGHSTRVAEYTLLLADKLNLSKNDKHYAYYVAILHDIGKCYVPDEILKKPGRLTDEEFHIIQSHTSYGADMLKSIKSIPGIAEGANYHHERYDGKGYPKGLKGEDIPYIARIICVADTFDAMTTSRCYRKALSKETVLAELEKGKGTQFDPKVADAMIALIKEGKIHIENWD